MTKPDLSLVERLLHRAEQTELRAPYADAPASEALPRMEAMLADAKLDREAADALAEQAAVREELCGALKAFVKQWEIYLIIEPAAPGNDREFPSITMSRESWERARAAVRLAEDAS